MNSADLDKELAAGDVKPVYLFYGREAFLKERYLAKLVERVQEEFRDFNLQSLSADETSPAEVLDQARTLPFMAPPRVVILRGVDRYKADDLLPFYDYLSDPNESACLVLVADKPDFRFKFFKAVRDKGLGVEFSAPRGRGLTAWVREAMADRGQEMTEAVAQVLVDRFGGDLMELDRELEKVSLYALDKKKVGEEDVRAAARMGHRATVFQLGDALGRQDPDTALTALRDLLLTEHYMVILAMVVRHFRLLLKAKPLLDRRGTQAEAAAKLGVPGFAARNYLAQARGLSLGEIKKGLACLLEANLTLITSSAPERLVMESLVLDLALLRPNRRPGL